MFNSSRQSLSRSRTGDVPERETNSPTVFSRNRKRIGVATTATTMDFRTGTEATGIILSAQVQYTHSTHDDELVDFEFVPAVRKEQFQPFRNGDFAFVYVFSGGMGPLGQCCQESPARIAILDRNSRGRSQSRKLTIRIRPQRSH